MATLTSEMAQPREAQTARFARLRRQEQWRLLYLLIPGVVFLFAFYGYPVASMLLRSVSDPTWGWQNFQPLTEARSTIDVLGASLPMNAYIRVFWITLQIAFVVTLLYAAARIPGGVRPLVDLDVARQSADDPGADPVLDQHPGPLLRLDGAAGAGGDHQRGADRRGRAVPSRCNCSIRDWRSISGMVHILLPFMILPLYAVMRGIDRNLLRAAGEPGRAALGGLSAHLPAAEPAGDRGGMPAGVHPVARVLHHAGAAGRSARHHGLDADPAAG